jgi:cell wall-associated NlpC family hydrolase
MKQIICPFTYIPIRKEASHRSEQVSQLLYGETARIKEENEEWILIYTNFDNYEGWVEKKTVNKFTVTQDTPNTIIGFARLVKIDGNSLWLSTGSSVYAQSVDTKTSTIVTINPELNDKSILEIALQFLGTPYLWGGRTFMGIDCSGFTQIVYKSLGISLPRDASQQVNEGKVIQFPSEAKVGDLAFFDNEEGNISHVGIFLESDKIIHASGNVRVDYIDHQGIYNHTTKEYTHKLRVIKRIS